MHLHRFKPEQGLPTQEGTLRALEAQGPVEETLRRSEIYEDPTKIKVFEYVVLLRDVGV